MVRSWSKLHAAAAPVTQPDVVLAAEDVDVWLVQRRDWPHQLAKQHHHHHPLVHVCHLQGILEHRP